MAQYLQHNTANDTAGGYYVVIWRENTNAWKPATPAFAAYTTTRDDFDIQASQNGTTGHYRVQWPTVMHVGWMQWSWFKEASVGARSHASDTQVGTGAGYWNGYSLIENRPEATTPITAVTSQSVLVIDGSAGIASQKDNTLIGYAVRVSNPTAGENGGFVSSWRRVTAHTYDSVGSTHSLTLDSSVGFTTVVGDYLELYPPLGLVKDIGDQLDTIEDGVGDITSGGPVEHIRVPASRTLHVKSRGDGTVGVVGTLRQQPDETLWWAVDCTAQLAAGDYLNAMEAPTVSGADAANASVPDYGVFGTLAKFQVTLDDTADEEDTINIELDLTPESGESLLVTVPVTVVE